MYRGEVREPSEKLKRPVLGLPLSRWDLLGYLVLGPLAVLKMFASFSSSAR